MIIGYKSTVSGAHNVAIDKGVNMSERGIGMKITPRDNLIDTIEFNFYQGTHDFDRSFWDKYIDAIEEKLQDQLEKAESILATLRTSESNTIMKSNCWQQSVEYFREKGQLNKGEKWTTV